MSYDPSDDSYMDEYEDYYYYDDIENDDIAYYLDSLTDQDDNYHYDDVEYDKYDY